MELLNPSVWMSITICSKPELKRLSELVEKYTSKGDLFLNACNKDNGYDVANKLIDESIKEMVGHDVHTALGMFADKFPQIPGLSDAVSNAILEKDKVLAIAKNSGKIRTMMKGM